MQYIVRTKDGTSWLIDKRDHSYQHLIPNKDTGEVVTESGHLLACTHIKVGLELCIFLPLKGRLDGEIGKILKTAPIVSVEDGEDFDVATRR
jgi:hypothetical protein